LERGQWVGLNKAVPQGLKPQYLSEFYGTAEAVPFQNRFKLIHYPSAETLRVHVMMDR
jgi:hypothetical protein